HRTHSVAANVQKMIAVPSPYEGTAMRLEQVSNSAAWPQRFLYGLKSVSADLKHLLMFRVDLSGQSPQRERGMIVPVRGGKLMKHLVFGANATSARMIAHEQRGSSAAHRPD